MKFDKQRPTVSVQVQNTFMFHVPSHTGAAERTNHPSWCLATRGHTAF